MQETEDTSIAISKGSNRNKTFVVAIDASTVLRRWVKNPFRWLNHCISD